MPVLHRERLPLSLTDSEKSSKLINESFLASLRECFPHIVTSPRGSGVASGHVSSEWPATFIQIASKNL